MGDKGQKGTDGSKGAEGNKGATGDVGQACDKGKFNFVMIFFEKIQIKKFHIYVLRNGW